MPTGVPKVSGEDTKEKETAAQAEVSAPQDPQPCKGEGEAKPVQKKTHETPKEDQAKLNKAPAEHDDSKAKKPEHAKAPATEFQEPKRDEKSVSSTLVALKLLRADFIALRDP